MAGAMTFVMIATILKVPDVTYGGLVNNMHEMVEQFNNKSCLSCKFIPKAFHHRQIQVGFPLTLTKPSLCVFSPLRKKILSI